MAVGKRMKKEHKQKEKPFDRRKRFHLDDNCKKRVENGLASIVVE